MRMLQAQFVVGIEVEQWLLSREQQANRRMLERGLACVGQDHDEDVVSVAHACYAGPEHLGRRCA